MQKAIDGKLVEICDGCGKAIPRYENVPSGYVSPYSPEMRQTNILGIAGVENVPRIVCKPCYRLDFKKVYPTKKCPI